MRAKEYFLQISKAETKLSLLQAKLRRFEELGLTIDVGHLFCQNEPIQFYVQRHAQRLVNIHFDEARRGVHEHLVPGEGGIDFEEFFAALRSISYSGGVFAELSRHSATGAGTAQKVFEFLTKFKD